MDKLQPLIKHHFWILCAMVLILPIVGWIPAASHLEKAREEKVAKIESAFSGIPNPVGYPNESWQKGVAAIAEKGEEKNMDQRVNLWRQQEALMVWPNQIRKSLQPENYRDVIDPKARNIYNNFYQTVARNVWLRADPFDGETGKGTVVFPQGLFPIHAFGNMTPTSEQIWDAQEDLWLLSSLLKSIRNANADSEVVGKSLVRSIEVLELVGGPGDYPDAEPTTDSFGGAEAMYDEMSYGEYADMMPGDGGGLGQGNRQPQGPASVSFNPADEFGEEQGRYIDYTEGTVFKRRGFYMEAIIEHQRLPELLIHLSNGDWPVTITRVQMAQADYSQTSLLNQGGNYPGNEYMEGAGSAPAMMEDYDIGNSEMPMDTFTTGKGNTTSVGPKTVTGEFANVAEAAKMGATLAKVAISGVFHLYNPPEDLGEETDGTDEAAPATEIPAGESLDAMAEDLTVQPEDLDEPDLVEPGEDETDLEAPETEMTPEEQTDDPTGLETPEPSVTEPPEGPGQPETVEDAEQPGIN